MTSAKISSILFILFGAFLIFESRKYSMGTIDNPGPGFLPFLLGIAIGLMSIVLAIKVWRKMKREDQTASWPKREGLIKVSLIFIVILLFTALLETTGYMINVFVLFVILLRPVGKQKWLWTLSISVGATLGAYLLFDRWLMLPLPRGIWFG
ncbi:MAG: tripartite tricarboxylate transporter TctB family protein [Thermodesulfobacteriota bacterium]